MDVYRIYSLDDASSAFMIVTQCINVARGGWLPVTRPPVKTFLGTPLLSPPTS